jgi:alpha-ketoglutarate-dependent taurine dioxygenase
MGKLTGFTAESLFNLSNAAAYAAWRTEKLTAAKNAFVLGFVEISDPLNMSDSEVEAILSRCRDTNIALYSIAPESDDSILRRNLRAMAEQLGLGEPEGRRSKGEASIVALTVSNRPSERGFIPYTRKALNWHTDGYYNAPDNTIRGFILHCVQDALAGGNNQLLDNDIAYIRLRDENPDYITALMHPQAMTIPETHEEDGSLRPASIGPVFHVEGDDLIMRYTARTRSIEWRDDPTTREAVAFLQNLLIEGDPLMLEAKLKPGQGVINNNSLHNRTAFDPAEVGNNSRRVMYRVRFNKRIGSK